MSGGPLIQSRNEPAVSCLEQAGQVFGPELSRTAKFAYQGRTFSHDGRHRVASYLASSHDLIDSGNYEYHSSPQSRSATARVTWIGGIHSYASPGRTRRNVQGRVNKAGLRDETSTPRSTAHGRGF
ncbi:hypothetical protein JHW43_008307 [Diplocarpon mali]|nr:hypothetical protein JHW43_008307 [Diplocarpon mali]